MKALLLAIVLLCPALAMATPRSIHAKWSYTPPSEPAVTGFRLYRDGVAVHDWPGADVRVGAATVDLTETSTIFSMTATFADGTESPHSAPFAFNPNSSIKFVWLKYGNRSVPISKPKGVRLR